MTATTWDTAIAERVKHLAGLGKLPPPGAHPALSALAVLSLIAATGIRHALIPASSIPKLSLPGAAATVSSPATGQAHADRRRAEPR